MSVEMEALAQVPGGPEAADALRPLITAYRSWIAEQSARDVGTDGRRETRDHLIAEAKRASDQLANGPFEKLEPCR